VEWGVNLLGALGVPTLGNACRPCSVAGQFVRLAGSKIALPTTVGIVRNSLWRIASSLDFDLEKLLASRKVQNHSISTAIRKNSPQKMAKSLPPRLSHAQLTSPRNHAHFPCPSQLDAKSCSNAFSIRACNSSNFPRVTSWRVECMANRR